MNTLIVFACIVVAASAQCSYSSVCKDHTMCIYPNVGPNCMNLRYSGVTKGSDKQTIEDEHNRLRSIVANGQEKRGNPGPQSNAANMNKIHWNETLATVAQRWANQCKFGHDSCRNEQQLYVGQNVYMTSSKGSPETDTQDWKAAVQGWYNEVSKFNKNSISPFSFTSDTGHYTQVAWATTKYIGCGFTAWKGNDGWFNKLYVCNYGPGGNVIGTNMYATGQACSLCSHGCQNGLCL